MFEGRMFGGRCLEEDVSKESLQAQYKKIESSGCARTGWLIAVARLL